MRKLLTVGLVVLLIGLVLSVPLKVNALQDEKSIVEEADEMIFMQSMPTLVQRVLKLQVYRETIFILGVFVWCILQLIREIIYIPAEIYHLFLAILTYAKHRLMIIKQGLK